MPLGADLEVLHGDLVECFIDICWRNCNNTGLLSLTLVVEDMIGCLAVWTIFVERRCSNAAVHEEAAYTGESREHVGK